MIARHEDEHLEVKNLQKSFGGLKAINNLSMFVKDKRITILMGPNGSGKTTLVNLVTGFLRPDSGEIIFHNRKINGLKPDRVFNEGIVRTFQVPALFPAMTVLENVLVAQRKNPGELLPGAFFKSRWEEPETQAIDRALEILDMLDLSDHWRTQASNLSGGQMKLLEIGRALMGDAKLLLLDEPVSGVNPTLAHQIFRTLADLRDQHNLTFLAVEHRLDVALEYADDVNVLASGQLIASGTPEQVMNDPRVIEVYLGRH
jgi:branched-chain amino acid transport system ATP-binding protein